jgi:hypothetical protein
MQLTAAFEYAQTQADTYFTPWVVLPRNENEEGHCQFFAVPDTREIETHIAVLQLKIMRRVFPQRVPQTMRSPMQVWGQATEEERRLMFSACSFMYDQQRHNHFVSLPEPVKIALWRSIYPGSPWN